MPEDNRREPRVATRLEIRLAYGSVDEFVEGWALNLSRGGMFVRARELLPPGTEVAFDVRLRSGRPVIRGSGVVRWTAPSSGPEEDEQGGMGIQFSDLTLESRALVDRVVTTMGPTARSDQPPIPDGVEPERIAAVLKPARKSAQGEPEARILHARPAFSSAPTPPPLRPSRTGAPPAQGGGAGSPGAAGEDPSAVTNPGMVLPTRTPGRPAAGSARGGEPTATAQELSAVTSPGMVLPTMTPLVGGHGVARPARSGTVIGIDLGTTYSCAAVSRGGKAEVIASKKGYRTIPSVVGLDAQGRVVVGHRAKSQMVLNPRQTVYGSKRLVGRRFSSPTVQACRDRFHYEIVEGPAGSAAVRFGGRDYSLQQVSGLVLRKIREMASQALGEKVERAVVTVPAYYNDHQRNAVREAGALAGLRVERIVNEPTAAALAFGHGRSLDSRVLVYDLGGGTFDASVLEIQGDVYEVVSTGGDTFLGGVDFDGRLVDHLARRFTERNGFAPPDDRAAWQRIREAAEETKIALSSSERAVARVPRLCRTTDGEEYGLEVEVTRAELEALTGQLVDRTLDVCRDVLAARKLGKEDIDEVVLVGGQTRMPLVWRRIQEELGREPSKSVHPDEAVALGAALLAESTSRIDSVVLIDALAMGIGVGLPGGRMAPVLARNSKLPVRKAYGLATTEDGQTSFELQVFQGDSPKVSECEYLGTVRIGHLPARPRGEVKVEIEFSAGVEGLVEVKIRDVATGRATEARLATIDTPESIMAKLQMTEPQTPPKGARPLDAVPLAPPPRKRGFFGRLFGARS